MRATSVCSQHVFTVVLVQRLVDRTYVRSGELSSVWLPCHPDMCMGYCDYTTCNVVSATLT